MTLKEAKEEAKELSIQQWNRYFHVIKKANEYIVSRYYEEGSVWYFLKGIGNKQISKAFKN